MTGPEKPVWEDPCAFQRVNSVRADWLTIDGVDPIANRCRTHQLMMLAPSRWYHKWLKKTVLPEICLHLELEHSVWKYQQLFLERFISVFLKRYEEYLVLLQILPQRKTFRNLHVENVATSMESTGQSQTHGKQRIDRLRALFSASCLSKPSLVNSSQPGNFVFPCSSSLELKLANGMKVPSDGLILYGHGDEELEPVDQSTDLKWLEIQVERTLERECVIDNWFCLGTSRDCDSRIRNESMVPALGQFFDQSARVQSAPIVSFNAIDRWGTGVATHCFSLHPQTGYVIDIRQSNPSLKYYCRGAPFSDRGLRRLLYGETEKNYQNYATKPKNGQ